MPEKVREVKTVVYRVVRAQNSASGNPAYTFRTERGPFRTATDTMQALALENDFEVDTTLDKEVTLKLTGGRVFDWEIHKKEAGK